MASDNEASCESDPNFAVICAFMEKFGGTCGLASVDFLELQEMLENTQEVPQELIDLHIKLLRKSRKTVSNERWEKAVIKFCHSFCVQDAWEIERFGYKKARLSSKLRVLKELLEMQFDFNARFKAEINKMSAEELRSQPLGKDKRGHAYWFQNDNNCQIRVYKEDPDEETWTLVAKDRDGLVSLIGELSDGDSKLSSESGINEDDSNSLAEKPIIDTGQVDSSSESAKKTSTDSENSNESTKKDDEVGSKRSRDSDDDIDAKKPKLEVGEAVEEPLMLVKGEGAGKDNNSDNPIVGDEIEEEVMFFHGVGSGFECQTGNEDKPQQSETNATDATKSGDYSISASDVKKCGDVVSTSSSVKSPFRLGTIIDTKTDRLIHAARSPTKKSRWDVETIVAKHHPDGEEEHEVPKKKSMFFFGPGCLHFGPTATVGFGQKVPREVNAKGDVGYRIGDSNDCVQALEEQIVPEADGRSADANCNVPEVTAVLVGCGDSLPSCSVNDKGSETVPVHEEPCVKKHAYLLGNDKDEGSVDQNQQLETETEISAPGVVQNHQSAPSEVDVDPQIEGSEHGNDTLVDERNEESPENRTDAVDNQTTETILEDKTSTEAADVEPAAVSEVEETEEEVEKTRTNVESVDGQDLEVTELKDVDVKQVDINDIEDTDSGGALVIDEPQRAETEASNFVSSNASDIINDEEKATEDIAKPSKDDGEEKLSLVDEVESDEDEREDNFDDERIETDTEDVALPNAVSVDQIEVTTNKEVARKQVEDGRMVEIDTRNVEDVVVASISHKIEAIIPPAAKMEDLKKIEDVASNTEDPSESVDEISTSKHVEGVSIRVEELQTLKTDKIEESKNVEPFATHIEDTQVSGSNCDEVDIKTPNLVTDKTPEERNMIVVDFKEEKVEKIDGDIKTINEVTFKEEKATVIEVQGAEEQKIVTVHDIDQKSEKTESFEQQPPESDSFQDTESNINLAEVSDIAAPEIDKVEDMEPIENALVEDQAPQIDKMDDLPETVANKVTKEAIVVLDTLKIDVANNANKTNRNRKNNSDQTPKVSTRRTRSSRNEEADDALVMLQPQRRARPRKTEKDEDAGKKRKMSGEETAPVENSGSSSNDATELPDKDPLAVSDDDVKAETEAKPMSLATFSLDFTESPPPPRKRSRESPPNSEEVGERAGKRQKMKAKRAVDVKLRKSIENQKKQELVSSDDDTKGERREKKHKSEEGSDAEKKASKKVKNKNKRLLSNLGIDPDRILIEAEATIGVRQSRRIAQQKIREEAERRKLEEDLLMDAHKKKKSKKSEDKDYKVEKKRLKNDNDEDEPGEDDSRDSKKKKRKKKKHRLFDELNPWRSSSDSSSSEEEEEEEIAEESDEVLQYVSDHEFSPESDMEGDGEAQPLKRARTARKESDVEEEIDDCPCQKCGKSDHPEWILLCDQCDNGWHCSCLRPPLLVIPEGDWFCPPCQHLNLLTKLQDKLTEYDKKMSKKEIEDRRKQRLAYVGISLNSVLPETVKKRRVSAEEGDIEADDDDDDDEEEDAADDDAVADAGDDSSSDESVSGSVTEEFVTSSASDDDEPIYQLRQRRQAHSYRFNDYDELINSAIQDEMEAVKGAGNQGRGKDIATIVNAEKEEEERKKDTTEVDGEVEGEVEREPLPPVVPLNDKDKEAKPLYSDEEPIGGSRKKIVGRKKHRKLNSLDISSEDEDSDEDFKGTSSESDDDFEEDLGSEDSEELGYGTKGRKKGSNPIRRSTRARTSRYDADFIDDGDSEEEEEEAPRRKKKRSIWDESESEESDRSWGRRKRKPAPNRSKKTTTATNTTSSAKKKKSKKKKKENDDSDAEVYKKKKPKIKFGLEGESEGPIRRTRGKKINYVDALGSDSEEDRVKRPPPRIESEEEYVADEDDEKNTDEEAKLPKIQSYADPQFTRLLPEGVPTPRVAPLALAEDGDDEPNPIDQINRNVEMMDENEMEKMMEEEEYANKQLQLVALQLEKEKRRKEREAKKLEEKKLSAKKAKEQQQFQFSGPMQEPIVGNVDRLIVNAENNDELSEPPGVSLPMFAELGTGGGESLEDLSKKRRGKSKKSLEEAVANLGSTRQQQEPFVQAHPTDLSNQDANIEIAAPPQPFSQSQPTPSVITRMLQSKPIQPGYPVGTIRPKQFAAMPEREEEMHHVAAHPGQYIQGLRPYRPMPPAMNHYAPRPPLRNPSPLMYHPHRPMDPSPSGGGTISSPGRVVSPAASSPGSNKNETPPPPYSRPPPPAVGRFPITARHMHLAAPHLRPNLSPYHPGMPPAAAAYHYGQFEDALPPTIYQNASPYAEQFTANEAPPLDSNSSSNKPFEEESGGEFGGLVSYFSSQREDDLES